jgi:hypothetical protein
MDALNSEVEGIFVDRYCKFNLTPYYQTMESR